MEENVLDTEVEAAEEAEEIFEETEEVVADDNQEDDEFEYDEEGNIVIPEVDFEDEEDSEEEEDTDTEEDESKNKNEDDAEEESADPDEEPAKEQEKAEEREEKPEAKPDPRDARIKELEDKLRAIESQSKDTLKKLGKENVDNLVDGLAELAAEATGTPLKEYKEEREKELRAQLEEERQRNIAFEAKAQSDLKELHLAYPETQKYKHVRELPAEILQKFGKYRDLGLNAKEAYAAANPDGVRADVAASVKKQAMHDSKAHLQSTVPKSSKNDGVVMSKAELISWREMFPNMSDAEIKKLYKQSQ